MKRRGCTLNGGILWDGEWMFLSMVAGQQD